MPLEIVIDRDDKQFYENNVVPPWDSSIERNWERMVYAEPKFQRGSKTPHDNDLLAWKCIKNNCFNYLVSSIIYDNCMFLKYKRAKMFK